MGEYISFYCPIYGEWPSKDDKIGDADDINDAFLIIDKYSNDEILKYYDGPSNDAGFVYERESEILYKKNREGVIINTNAPDVILNDLSIHFS